jgi:hypothetical protein
MQLSAQLSQIAWPVLLGWASIAAGLALAVQTLGFGRPKAGVAHMLRAYRPADWSQRQPSQERRQPMDATLQLQKVVAIAETGLARIESVADLHARAAGELEAVDDALIRMLAGFTPDEILSVRQHEADPAAAPVTQPLAA